MESLLFDCALFRFDNREIRRQFDVQKKTFAILIIVNIIGTSNIVILLAVYKVQGPLFAIATLNCH
jgi:GTP cyclohydrolase FolE2